MAAHPVRIPLSAPSISDAERTYVNAALRDGWISGTGEFVTQFEQGLSARFGRRRTVAVANGTLGLELVLRGLDIGPGDEVILPALTFAAPAMSVLAVGASVVLADVAPGSWTIDPAQARALLSDRTKAVIAVDLLGHPADYDALAALGVPVVQDAAEAHGAHYKGRQVGAQGDCSVFSFHANKAVTTGEGGSVSTDDEALADRMGLIANHGMSRDRPYVHDVIGRNFRMSNLVAAFGVGQLGRWTELVAARNAVSDRYHDLLWGTGCEPAPVAEWADRSCWLHTVSLEHREAVLRRVRAAGVDARAIWPVLDEQPVLAHLAGDFPVARDAARRAVWLPTYAGMSEEEICFVADAVTSALRTVDQHGGT
jgi:perosamine synthetase